MLADSNDVQARGNLMWDSAMAENGILKVGRLTDFQAHQMEHQLGAYTDCNHGHGDYTGGTAKSSGHLQHHKMQSA